MVKKKKRKKRKEKIHLPNTDRIDTGSIPGLGRSPGVGNGNPLQHSSLENSMDRGAWQGSMGSQRVEHERGRGRGEEFLGLFQGRLSEVRF